MINGAHFFLEGPLTGGGGSGACCCWEGPPFSTELPRGQLCSAPAAMGEEEPDWAASQTTWKPCGWRGCRQMLEIKTRHRAGTDTSP